MPVFKLVDEWGNPIGTMRGNTVERGGRVVGVFERRNGVLYYIEFNEYNEPVKYGYVDEQSGVVRSLGSRRSTGRLREEKPSRLPFLLFFVAATAFTIFLGGLGMRKFEDYIPTFFVASEGEEAWTKGKQLSVFENGRYENAKIYPGMSGDYQFRLQNENGKRLLYSLDFEEPEDSLINMKYRLRLGEEYVAGDENTYVTLDELDQADGRIEANQSAIYTLEWKWEDSEEDALAGMSRATYTLDITFSGKLFALSF